MDNVSSLVDNLEANLRVMERTIDQMLLASGRKVDAVLPKDLGIQTQNDFKEIGIQCSLQKEDYAKVEKLARLYSTEIERLKNKYDRLSQLWILTNLNKTDLSQHFSDPSEFPKSSSEPNLNLLGKLHTEECPKSSSEPNLELFQKLHTKECPRSFAEPNFKIFMKSHSDEHSETDLESNPESTLKSNAKEYSKINVTNTEPTLE